MFYYIFTLFIYSLLHIIVTFMGTCFKDYVRCLMYFRAIEDIHIVKRYYPPLNIGDKTAYKKIRM